MFQEVNDLLEVNQKRRTKNLKCPPLSFATSCCFVAFNYNYNYTAHKPTRAIAGKQACRMAIRGGQRLKVWIVLKNESIQNNLSSVPSRIHALVTCELLLLLVTTTGSLSLFLLLVHFCHFFCCFSLLSYFTPK